MEAFTLFIITNQLNKSDTCMDQSSEFVRAKSSFQPNSTYLRYNKKMIAKRK